MICQRCKTKADDFLCEICLQFKVRVEEERENEYSLTKNHYEDFLKRERIRKLSQKEELAKIRKELEEIKSLFNK